MIFTVNKAPATIFCLFLALSAFLCSARDTITRKNPISEHKKETLVSAGGLFELGFFTPNVASDNRTYIGIWYHNLNPRTVVWVANRDRPLLGSPGSFEIDENGNLRVSNATTNLWSTSLAFSSASRTVKLMDTGNLVLSNDDQPENSLWESFKNPTDTFLPGMKMEGSLSLTSWIHNGDPGTGRFKFNLSREGDNTCVISRKAVTNGGLPVPEGLEQINAMPEGILDLLSNFTSSSDLRESNQQLYSSRLVINYTGRLEHLNLDIDYWNLLWWGPGKCSIANKCGNFGSCNANNWIECKCLPGFKPSNSKNWNSGIFSDGCTGSSTCLPSDTFLILRRMQVETPTVEFHVENENDCSMKCLQSCACDAYSYEATTSEQASQNKSCRIWNKPVRNLQEENENSGQILFVRVAKFDIEPTARSCEPCGTNMIPYPLSTKPNCGDPMYFSFDCNYSTSQLSFTAPSGSYRVTRMDPITRKFFIKANAAYDRNSGGNLLLNNSLAFIPDSQSFHSEVGIRWKPPQEPICTSSMDCRDLPQSTCDFDKDGKRRCLCTEKLQWNSSDFSCTKGDLQKGSTGNALHSLTLMLPLTIVFILACAITSTYLWRRKIANRQEHKRSDKRNRALRSLDSERHVKELIGSVGFQEEDGENIDVPFFEMESILAATDNFSNENKLGQGGYGPVYKGTFPGGKEIAIKRLSSVTGQGLQEFKSEVVLIAKLQHRNLVKLQGYCVKEEEKILLYEYMPNKSLDSFLFGQQLNMLLDWNLRVHIILGIARGLLYLHHDSRLRIIHRDLKTSNILLDYEMNPKISDFGLARMVEGKEIGANTTKVVGTYGYMSPEYAMEGLFSIKSDVFSFGVVLLEIVAGKKNTGFYQSELALSLVGYTWRLWTENKVLDLVDPALHEACNAEQFVKFVNVGLLCVQEDPNDRPTMSNVVTMLDSEAATLPTPKQPAFVPRPALSGAASSSSRPYTSVEITSTLEETA